MTSRVAPLKKLTRPPRLEVKGAVLASLLGKSILKNSRQKFEKSVFFLDSRIVSVGMDLQWNKAIRTIRVSQSWRDPTSEIIQIPLIGDTSQESYNVADDVSRGIPCGKLDSG